MQIELLATEKTGHYEEEESEYRRNGMHTYQFSQLHMGAAIFSLFPGNDGNHRKPDHATQETQALSRQIQSLSRTQSQLSFDKKKFLETFHLKRQNMNQVFFSMCSLVFCFLLIKGKKNILSSPLFELKIFESFKQFFAHLNLHHIFNTIF